MPNRLCLAALLALPLAACASTTPPVEVTRFHVDSPVRSGTIAVEELPGNPDVSLEFQNYAGVIAQEWQRAGFTPVAQGGRSDYVVLVAFRRNFRPGGVDRSGNPVSVGVGGGVGSRGYSGMGLGIGINLSGRPKDIITTELQLQLRRRGEQSNIWEGRAIGEAKQGTPAGQPIAAVQRLTAALLQGYPGESGRTISVK